MYRIEKLSEEFVSKFFQLCAEKVSSNQIERFIYKTESQLTKFYFTKSSEINLLRILENQFQLNLFISDVLKYNHYIEILLTIATYSNYLTDILVQNPGYFYWITNPDTLTDKLNKKYFENSIKRIDTNYSNFNSKVNSLRNFKKQEILRIGILDYFLKAPLPKITELLTQLANSICNYLFSLCLDEIKSKYGVKKLPEYCIISLGKLGGNELNYSSDIDLILFTESNKQLSNNLYSNTIYENAIKLFISTSSQITAKGDLYRIDFRLRPYGRNSELINTIANYLYYYENQSEQWEKQMLIKNSYLGGNKKLYKRFNDFIQNIIYPKTFLRSPIEKLKSLKLNIENNINTEQNIKLSSGGIRDIEFATQALLLLNGGKKPDLRERNTLKSLRKLWRHKLIDEIEYTNLKSNYILFRKIEHFMQLMNNFQTHLIPESSEVLEKLSYVLDYPDSNIFLKEVNDRRSFNASFFNQIVNPNNSKSSFDKIKFADKKKAYTNFNYLSTGTGLINTKKFDEPTVISFNQISESIISYLDKSKNPDKTLDNFTKIIKSSSLPIFWFDNLNDVELLNLTLKICERSTLLFNYLLESKQAVDFFISRKAFAEIDEKLFDELNSDLFKFISGLQLFVGMINTDKFHKLQTNYFIHKIKNLVDKEGLINKYQNDFIIIGLGSFASEEMNFFSDIDLVFIVNQLDQYPNVQSDFQKLLNDLKAKLRIEIDCRLRPEGKSSPLVWNYQDYISYIKSRAEVWEFLTFTKSIFISGDKEKFDELMNVIIYKVSSLEERKIKNDLLKMRNRLVSDSSYIANLKKSKGGLVDLYFINGFYILKYGNEVEHLFHLSMIKKLEILNEVSSEKNLFDKIINNYLFIKNFEIFYQILSGSKSVRINNEDENYKYLSELMGFASEKDLIERLNIVLSENIKSFNQIFY